MKTNFDFLKNIDEELFEIVLDAQKLFQDEYFNQSCVQLRIFAEKIAKNLLGQVSQNQTFDDILNCLKDKIKDEREKEFIEDLFFIKKLGNESAHGKDVKPSDTLKAFERAFEAAVSYVWFIKKDKEIDKLEFDCTLLITGKKQQETKLGDKYLKLAKENPQEFLNLKQGEFLQQVDKNENSIENKSYVNNVKSYKKDNKSKKAKIKEQIKLAKKNLKENLNTKKTANQKSKPLKNASKGNDKSKKTKKQVKKKFKISDSIIKKIIFIIFVLISLSFITKMLIFY